MEIDNMEFPFFRDVWNEGYVEGYIEGKLESEREAFQWILSKTYGPLPQEVIDRINCASTEELHCLTKRVALATSLQEVFQDALKSTSGPTAKPPK